MADETKAMRSALVTGASRGIGAAIARRLAADGLRVVLHYRERRKDAEAVLNEIESAGGQGDLMELDLSQEEESTEALDVLFHGDAAPLVVVNNAGITDVVLATRLGNERWRRVLETNLSGPFRVIRAALPGMVRARWGRIVNVASVSGETGNVGQANYCASKAGLIGLTRAIAREYARRNVLANVVSPGFIETEMTASIPRSEAEALIPMRRAGSPDEVAGVVSFLCSADASYVTGQVLSVNGGMFIG